MMELQPLQPTDTLAAVSNRRMRAEESNFRFRMLEQEQLAPECRRVLAALNLRSNGGAPAWEMTPSQAAAVLKASAGESGQRDAPPGVVLRELFADLEFSIPIEPVSQAPHHYLIAGGSLPRMAAELQYLAGAWRGQALTAAAVSGAPGARIVNGADRQWLEREAGIADADASALPFLQRREGQLWLQEGVFVSWLARQRQSELPHEWFAGGGMLQMPDAPLAAPEVVVVSIQPHSASDVAAALLRLWRHHQPPRSIDGIAAFPPREPALKSYLIEMARLLDLEMRLAFGRVRA